MTLNVPALLLALALLVPLHELPWTAFHGDLFAGGALGLLAFRSEPRRWPLPALLVLALSLVPLAQHAAGLVMYRGDAVVASLYLGGLALAIKLGADSPEATRSLALGILGAAWISAFIALAQAAGLVSPSAWLGPQHPEGRAVANLAQPNLLATLLSLGLVVQLAAWPQARRWRALALLGAAGLMAALALTGSRSGLLQALTVLGAMAVLGQRSGNAATRAELATLFAILLAAAAAWSIQQPVGGRGWLHGQSVAARWGYAGLFVDAVIASPWVGYGFNQVSVAQSRQMLLSPSPMQWAEHTHNIALDLLIWCGLPLGLLVLALLCWVLLRGWRRAWHDPALAPVGLGIAVMLIHAMLEFPLDYFVFLLPFGVMLGRLSAAEPSRQIPALVHHAGYAALALGTLLVLADYRTLAPELARARATRSQQASTANPPTLVLDQLTAQVTIAKYMNGAPAADLHPLEAASERFAYPVLLEKLRRDATRLGDPAMAARLARRLAPQGAVHPAN